VSVAGGGWTAWRGWGRVGGAAILACWGCRAVARGRGTETVAVRRGEFVAGRAVGRGSLRGRMLGLVGVGSCCSIPGRLGATWGAVGSLRRRNCLFEGAGLDRGGCWSGGEGRCWGGGRVAIEWVGG